MRKKPYAEYQWNVGMSFDKSTMRLMQIYTINPKKYQKVVLEIAPKMF
jgi:hypothetical protein